MQKVKRVETFHIDDRGEMSYLLDGKIPIISALLITSKKGSIRANHVHKKDSHYAYLLKGKMEYTYRDHNKENNKKRMIILNEGDIVYTPPMEEHAMKFLEDSIFIAFTTEERDQKKYELDLIRVNLI